MFVGNGPHLTAALGECPWMAARCPHKQAGCDEDDSAQCHHVTTTTANVRMAVVNLRSQWDRLEQADREHLRGLQGFLDGVEARRRSY